MSGPFNEVALTDLRVMPFVVHAGSNPELVQIVRDIRNDCRAFMTRHTAEISITQQELWWKNFDHARARLYLYMYQDHGYVGFGYVRKDTEDKTWVTGALIPDARGFGFGRDIFRHLTAHSDEVWLEVLKTNIRAVSLYKSLGYRETAEIGGVVEMVRRIR